VLAVIFGCYFSLFSLFFFIFDFFVISSYFSLFLQFTFTITRSSKATLSARAKWPTSVVVKIIKKKLKNEFTKINSPTKKKTTFFQNTFTEFTTSFHPTNFWHFLGTFLALSDHFRSSKFRKN